MSALVSRRGLLGRTVAVAAGASLVAPAAMAAPAGDGDDPVVTMGAEWERLRALASPIAAARDAAFDRMPQDCRRGAFVGLPLVGTAYDEGTIRDHFERIRLERLPTSAERQRFDKTEEEELVAKLRGRQAYVRAAGEAAGFTSVCERPDNIYEAEEAVEERLGREPAISPAGVAAQMRVLIRYVEDGSWAMTIAETVLAGLEACRGGRS